MADRDAGPRGEEDASRGPAGDQPAGSDVTSAETTAEPGSGAAAGSGVGSAGHPTSASEASTESASEPATGPSTGPVTVLSSEPGPAAAPGPPPAGYVYGPGGAGWSAPGWSA